MKLNRITALAVMVAATLTSIPALAEEREGVLVTRPALAARPIGSGAVALSDPQLVQMPSPVYRMPSQRIPARALAWTAIGLAALFTCVRVTTPVR